MRWNEINKMTCSVARSLSVVGDRWTMLILREAFMGRHRFDEFQQLAPARFRDFVDAVPDP